MFMRSLFFISMSFIIVSGVTPSSQAAQDPAQQFTWNMKALTINIEQLLDEISEITIDLRKWPVTAPKEKRVTLINSIPKNPDVARNLSKIFQRLGHSEDNLIGLMKEPSLGFVSCYIAPEFQITDYALRRILKAWNASSHLQDVANLYLQLSISHENKPIRRASAFALGLHYHGRAFGFARFIDDPLVRKNLLRGILLGERLADLAGNDFDRAQINYPGDHFSSLRNGIFSSDLGVAGTAAFLLTHNVLNTQGALILADLLKSHGHSEIKHWLENNLIPSRTLARLTPLVDSTRPKEREAFLELVRAAGRSVRSIPRLKHTNDSCESLFAKMADGD